MSEFQPALDELRQQRKGKPGELVMWIGLAIMLAAPFALILTNENGAKLAAMKADGVVAQATVTDKAVRSETYFDTHNRSRTRDLHFLNLTHDLNAQLAYADWKVGAPFPVPQYPAVTTREINVPQAYYEAADVGGKITVIHLPSDYGSMMPTEQFEFESSPAYRMWWYLGTALAICIGVAMASVGWRKRRGHG